MTTPKLHPAAVRAAKKIIDGDEQQEVAQIIHAAIDDHLKYAGWEELRDATQLSQDEISNVGSVSNGTFDYVDEAVYRVRGEKP